MAKELRTGIIITVSFFAFFSLAGEASAIGGGDGNPDLKTPEKSVEKFRALRVGAFIHWNPSALVGQEISWCRGAVGREKYDNLYKQFKAEKFNPKEWVKLFREAGFKYIVYATKHHDGFCMWDTKTTDYNVMNSPLGRDVVKELTAECKKQGVVFCPYYSIADWYQPDYTPHGHGGPGYSLPEGQEPDMDRYVRYMKAHLKELTENYGPFRAWWFDGHWEGTWTHERGTDLYAYMKELQPDVLVSNRIDDSHYAGRNVPDWFASEENSAGDYATPEGKIGPFNRDIPWESCMLAAHQWAWKPHDPLRPLGEWISNIVNNACRDGNIIIGIGPMSDGRFEPRLVDQLRELGVWLKYNGESIYGTRGGPFKPTGAYGSTCKGNIIYVHVFNTNEGTVILPGIKKRIVNSRLLSGGKVDVERTRKSIKVTIGKYDVQTPLTIVALELDGSAEEIAPLERKSLTRGKKVRVSNFYQNQEQWKAELAVDGNSATRWATDYGIKQAWLQVDLGGPTTFSEAGIGEALDRIRKFELQKKENGEWVSFYQGTTIGTSAWLSFEPVTTQYVRLFVTEAVEGPTICEFNLYE